jgi:hypothetical protein
MSIRTGLDTSLDIQRPALWAESLSSGKRAYEKLGTRNYSLVIKHLFFRPKATTTRRLGCVI